MPSVEQLNSWTIEQNLQTEQNLMVLQQNTFRSELNGNGLEFGTL